MPHSFMAASLQGVKKGSLVHRFITAGKPGKCELCPSVVEKLEAHHLCYSPEKTIKLCHNCHHKVHFWPNRLSDLDKSKLLSRRYGLKHSQELMRQKPLSIPILAKMIAPSRSLFVRAQQQFEVKRIKPKHTKVYTQRPR